jgi:hypothetical protein
MSVKTQGTELWFINPATGEPVKVGCVTTINGLTATRDQIETTCLDSAGREYVAGMPTPGAATFGINFDPADPSHVLLHDLYTEGTTLEWALGWSDGTADPTADTGGFVLPTSRTWLTFDGFVSDLPFDFSINAVVASSVSVQVSGFPLLTPKV